MSEIRLSDKATREPGDSDGPEQPRSEPPRGELPGAAPPGAEVPEGTVADAPATGQATIERPGAGHLSVRDLSLWYGDNQALRNVSLDIARHRVTSFIGPSGCGKTTLLRCFNRLTDLVPDCRIEGDVVLEGESVFAPELDVSELRRNVGMVFQKPNPFPKSIYENVAYGLRVQGINKRRDLDDTVEWALKAAALWDEVKDRLDATGLSLSGGQQQRLVIARAIAVQPKVILLDEPCSSLDPISTLKVEELIQQLREQYTIIVVTHNMQQAARVSDQTAFMYLGEVVEFGDTDDLFTNPQSKATEDYITGRYG